MSSINRLLGILEGEAGEGGVGGACGEAESFLFPRDLKYFPLGATYEVGESGAVVAEEAVLGLLLKMELAPVLLVCDDCVEEKDSDIGRGTSVG